MSLFRPSFLRHWRPWSAAQAGLLATLSYSLIMVNDWRVFGHEFNDVRFIQGLLVGTRRSRPALLLSWIIHLLNGVALAELYAALVRRFLPGPGWLRGALFGEAFTLAAWSLTPLADKYHPLIKQGSLPRLVSWRTFLQNVLRHLVFGLILGWLYREDA